MAKKKKGPSRFVGSCGIYIVVRNAAGLFLLVQRRSSQVSEPKTLCSPGGIVERPLCLVAGGAFDFEVGARATAFQELREETGINLDESTVLSKLPVDGPAAFWGEALHRNFCVTMDSFPKVSGPEKASRHEVVAGGLDGIGQAAGDGYHAWVKVSELLERKDLMKGCRAPLDHLLAGGELDACPAIAEKASPELNGSPLFQSFGGVSATAPASHGQNADVPQAWWPSSAVSCGFGTIPRQELSPPGWQAPNAAPRPAIPTRGSIATILERADVAAGMTAVPSADASWFQQLRASADGFQAAKRPRIASLQ